MPENVALAVAVEIARLDDRPSCGRRAETDGQHELRAVHQPHGHIAARVTPQDVALAVTVEVAGSGHGPGGGHISDPRRIGIQDGGAVHFPDCTVAAGVAPENVPLAIAVEVAGIDDGPGRGPRSAA